MNIGALILLTLTIGLVLFLVQRTESRRRLVVALIMAGVGLLIQRYANYRALHTEALIAFILALVINLLYWVIFGRYNPPGSSDDIQVLGMDD
jgi:hypothetical protein